MKPNKRYERGSTSGEQSAGIKTVPLFDCLTHPTINGDWYPGRPIKSADMDRLVVQMNECNVQWAFAVGMKGVGRYDEDKFSSFVRRAHPGIFPIAFLDFTRVHQKRQVRPLLVSLKKKGYRGIKIHPRLAGISLADPLLPYIVNTAAELDMVVLLCTYFYDLHKNAAVNNVENLISLLYLTKDSRMILLHAGSVRLLEMIEIARSYKNVLLDLSFTLCKYKGSSLDLDLAYAFRNFDKRICIGSDHPEFSLQSMRDRFEHFSAGLDKDKIENIAYRNLFYFTRVDGYETV